MILDGKNASMSIKTALKEKIEAFCRENVRKPSLTIIQVGNVEASCVYIRNKLKACEFVGIEANHIHLDENISSEELLNIINNLNSDENVDGVICQLPLPKHLNEELIINSIDPNKDVDGFHTINKGRLFVGEDGFKPATPYGIIKLLEFYNINLEGMNAVVIGRSNIVGKPVGIMLLEKNATVTICHSRTKNLKDICKNADIVVSAIGKAKYINSLYIKKGAIVVDVGMNHDEEGHLCGDVDYSDVCDLVSYITPVPGGVGPMTITMLLCNTFDAFLKKVRKC